ncbi:unnamed protein product [Cyclocybe aegerita]|uniref:Uncharacterized protein n=1 Tax=Cyclocybe aegerita TaxID=1973307 RepID=A0A8S0WWS3_CYCAE|nr:unnamed protein product [Cyclocybe aegerita]
MATTIGLSTSSAVTSNEGATLLPGFGRPVNYVPKKVDLDYVGDLFPNALSAADIENGRAARSMITLRETSMLQFMNSVTDKPDWHRKVKDDEIAKKWKEEALASTADFTETMAKHCIQELRHLASLVPPNPSPSTPQPPIVVYNGDVIKSDHALSPAFQSRLQTAVRAFEASIPERLRDWHPGSDGKVWDLVHPSLFPLVYGKTRVLEGGERTTLEDCVERSGQGREVPVPESEDIVEVREEQRWYICKATPFSAKFQWLPCDVDISGTKAKITSYINNLHSAKEEPLYALIEELVDASIPLWDATLTGLRTPPPHRIVYEGTEYDPDPASWPDEAGPQMDEGEDEDDYWDRRQEWIEATRVLVMPEPTLPFVPPKEVEESKRVDLRKNYGERGLQVIVKLANIQLTPGEKSKYEGGSWHVEGQLNEHIVATSLYYYDSENITPSTLAFRQQVDANEPMYYEQGCHL